MVGFVILLNLQLCFILLFFSPQLWMYLFEHGIPAYNIQQRKLVGFISGKYPQTCMLIGFKTMAHSTTELCVNLSEVTVIVAKT